MEKQGKKQITFTFNILNEKKWFPYAFELIFCDKQQPNVQLHAAFLKPPYLFFINLFPLCAQ